MIDIPFKLLPPALLTGLLLYGGVTAFWLQPLVERRMAEKTYLPQCEAGALRADSSRVTREGIENHTRFLALQALRNSPLAKLPGIAESLALADAEMRSALPNLPSLDRIDHGSLCACAVTSAFDEIRIPMMLHVMTARLYRPAQLTTMRSLISGYLGSGACGEISYEGARHG